MSPKTLRSHKTTAMITTAFKIDLMEPAMGMYELTSQRRTPTTTKTNTTWIKGMIYSFFIFEFQKCTKLLILEIGPAMRRQPIFVCPKLLLGTLVIVIGLGTGPIAPFPCHQFLPFHGPKP